METLCSSKITSFKKILLIITACLPAVIKTSTIVMAETYYVDSKNGKDSNPGTIEHPWQSIVFSLSSDSPVTPGDTVLVREGVYRESVIVKSSGTPGKHVTLKNYPEERPVIDGSIPLAGWQKCKSADECRGSSNWNNIYYTYAPAETAALTANLYQNDQILSLSQYPNPSDPFYMDNIENYLEVTPGAITNTSISDSRLSQFDNSALLGSYVAVWAQPNIVNYKRIIDFTSEEGKITFGEINAYTDRNSFYSILNSLHESILDKPGEFFFQETPEPDGTHKIFLWPLDNHDLSSEGTVTVSVLSDLIDLSDSSYFNLEGFKIQKGIGSIIQTPLSGTRTGVTIKNNEITKCRTDNTANLIYLYNFNSGFIEKNYLHHNSGRLRGIFVYKGNDVAVKDNIIRKQGGTCIYYSAVNNSQITNNSITSSSGSHSNGITTYNNCSDILVAGNIIKDSRNPLTMQSSANITLFNNLFHGSDTTMYVIANWGQMSGKITVLHNTILGSTKNSSLHIGLADQIIIKNNIIEGMLMNEFSYQRSHNIYTQLSWNQKAIYNWYLEDGELFENHLKLIFADSTGNSSKLVYNSPAINAGTDISEYLPEDIFQDYDFNTDITGRLRRGKPDIGCYEYDLINVPAEASSIQSAIDSAADGSTISVAPGTYYENISFKSKNIILISIDPENPDIVNSTVIDADSEGSAVTFTPTEASPSGKLSGFTITGGIADRGGGIYIESASPVIENCVIKQNIAVEKGGGICSNDSDTIIRNNRIINNISQYGYGGGIYSAAGSTQIINNIIAGNDAVFGAGLYSEYSADIITNNTIANNTSLIDWFACGITLLNSQIVPDFKNNIIAFNDQGLYVKNADPNNTSWITCNNIFANPGGNYQGDIPDQTAQNGNISADPFFFDSPDNDYHLRSTVGRWDIQSRSWIKDTFLSPCIDTGSLNDTVCSNEMWPHGSRINMGAYGGTKKASLSPSQSDPIDFNCDGLTNHADIQVFSKQWLTKCSFLHEDLNNDGTVNLHDFSILSETLGKYPNPN